MSAPLTPPLYPPKPMRAWPNTDLHKRVIADDNWVCEPKIDGDRCLIFFLPTGPQLWSRHGRQFTNSYLAGIKAQLATYGLPVGTVLDGELVAGTASQNLWLYDYASHDGSYRERRTALLAACPDLPNVKVVGLLNKATAYEDALAAKHEGIVWKRTDTRYEWQRSTSNNEVVGWIKMKP
jgi:ATP-dependent DNA ligase